MRAQMLLTSFAIGLLPPLLMAGNAPPPAGRIPHAHRTDREIYLLADIDKVPKTNEFVIIEKESGAGYVYSVSAVKSGYTTLALSSAFPAGVSPLADAAMLHDTVQDPLLATASADYHLISLTTNLDQATAGQTSQTSVQSFFALPSAIAPIAPPNGGISAGREDLLVISGSIPDGAGILNAGSLPHQSLYLQPDFSVQGLRDLQPIMLSGSTNTVIGIQTSGGLSSLLLMSAASALEKGAFTVIDSAPASPNLSGFTFFPDELPDKTFHLFTFNTGEKEITIYAVGAGGIAQQDTYSATEPLAFVQALESPDGYRLFLAYQSGKADVFTYDGADWLKRYSMQPLSDSSWLGILPAYDGSFYALHGVDGLATHFERIGYAGDYFHQASGTLNRPSITASWRDTIQAVAYTEKPFLGTPVPVQTYKHGDWSTKAFSNLNLTSWQYKDTTDGLFYPGAKSVGTLPAGIPLDQVALNQHQPDIAFWFGAGPVGAQGPIVQVDPASASRLTEAFQPALVALPTGTIFFRLGQTGDFSAASGGVPVITGDTVLEAYAVNGGLKGPITRATYAFDEPASIRDSDGDGLPDALEADIGSDPLNGDTDGDGSPDLADLLSGGQTGVKNDSLTATEADKQLAAGGYGAVSGSIAGQAPYPSRETVVLDAANPASGYASVIDAFNAISNGGNRLDAPLAATSGQLSIADAVGTFLGDVELDGESGTVTQVAISDPRQFLVSRVGSFSLVPEERGWRADFESSSQGWRVISGSTSIDAPRTARLDDPAGFAALVSKGGTDNRKLVYDLSQSALQWKGNYREITYDPSSPRSSDQRKAGRVRGLLCEVYSLDASRDGYLHLVLSNGTTLFVSEGQFLPKFDKNKIDASSSEALWTSLLFAIDSATFSLAYTASPGITFEDFLANVTEVAFVISDAGDPESFVSGSSYKGSTLHSGFAIDTIRAVGMPGGGYPLVALSNVPNRTHRFPPYQRDGSTSVTTAINQWISDVRSASTFSPISASLSVQSTLVAMLFEQALNGALYRQDPATHSTAKQLSVFHEALGNPDTVGTFSAEDLAFIRYPSRSVALPVIADAWEPQALLAQLATIIDKNRFEEKALSRVAHALYRLASTFTGIAPETFDDPLQTLYGFLNLKSLEAPWTDALLTLGIDGDVLAQALAEAGAIVSGALNSTERDMEVALQLTISDNGTTFTDAYDNTWDLLDRDGDGFLFPEQFAFPDGSVIELGGYTLPDGAQGKRLEVTEVRLVSLPPTTPQDTDGNLLDDRWERLFFGSTGIDPFADPDEDGYNNLSEFINGSDPMLQAVVDKNDDPANIPMAVNWPAPLRIERESNGDFRVILPMPLSQADQFNWTIEISNDLQSFSSSSATQEPGATEQVFIISASSFPKVFFRLKAQLR